MVVIGKQNQAGLLAWATSILWSLNHNHWTTISPLTIPYVLHRWIWTLLVSHLACLWYMLM